MASGRHAERTFVREKLNLLAPLVLSKLGAAGAAVAPVYHEEAIWHLLGSLTETQMTTIMGALGPEQAGALFEIYAAYSRRDANAKNASKGATEETKRASAPGEPMPES